MITMNRALRALCISITGSLVLAGPTLAATVRSALDHGGFVRGGLTLDRATHTYTFSGAAHHTAMQPLHSWMSTRAKTGKNLVYVSDLECGCVNIYPGDVDNPAPAGSITGLRDPEGMNFDPGGNLYVSMAEGDGVDVFPPGTTTPSFKYQVAYANSVIVDSNNVVYIGEGDLGGGRVVEYSVGSNTLLRTITDQALGGGTPYGFALDANNNLYVATGENAVYEFAPGATTGTNLGLTQVSGSRGVALDSHNDVFVTGFEIGGGNSVNEYLAGQVTVDRAFGVGAQPFEIAFGKKYTRLYVAQVGFENDGSVQAYDAKTTDLILTIRSGLEQPAGVALSPGVK